MVVYSPNPGGFASRGDHSSSNPNFYTGHQGIDSENCPDLAGRPSGVADSEMPDLVPGSTGDRGNSVPESDGSVAVDGSVVVRNKFSEPYFLRRVLREELDGDGGDHRLLVIAVHAVMQESGFVAVDPKTGMHADRLHLPDQGLSCNHSVLYRLVTGSNSPNMLERVSLIFQLEALGFSVNGYLHYAGLPVPRWLVTTGRPTRIRLDVCRFAPTFRLMRATGDGNDPEANEHSSSLSSYHVKEVLEFWKMVKDGLALPLLIWLTERAGLLLPPCFMRLPKELKLKILEPLPGSDLLRVGRVCSELRRLTSNNDDLWKRKYKEKGFEMPIESSDITNWKRLFACELEKERRRRSPPPWEVVLGIIRNRYGRPRRWVPPP